MAAYTYSDRLRVDADDLPSVCRVFDAHGAVIFAGDAGSDALQALEAYGLAPARPHAFRGDGRYSINDNVFNFSSREFQPLLQSPRLCSVLTALTLQGSGDKHWSWGRVGGDVVEQATESHQSLHSDWWSYDLHNMKFGYALCVSIACRDIGPEFGPIRFVPWSELKRYSQFPKDEDDVVDGSNFLNMHAGEILVRDCRCAHGGTANSTSLPRALPGAQVLAPGTMWNDEYAHLRSW